MSIKIKQRFPKLFDRTVQDNLMAWLSHSSHQPDSDELFRIIEFSYRTRQQWINQSLGTIYDCSAICNCSTICCSTRFVTIQTYHISLCFFAFWLWKLPEFNFWPKLSPTCTESVVRKASSKNMNQGSPLFPTIYLYVYILALYIHIHFNINSRRTLECTRKV